MRKSELPFGKTETTAREIRASVASEQAVKLLLKQGQSSEEAKKRVDSFLASIPELLQWLDNHGRCYPWREALDPWKVYVAEILLQRTRGDAVEKVYADFLSEFPAPDALQQATEEQIFELVRPLGFGNQRTKSLLDVGEILNEQYGGEVPADLEALQEPWRVGPYCARATLLFAHEQPMALVDSNFARVFGRVLDYEMPSQPHKSDDVYQLIEGLTPGVPELARAFNFAILDLGDAVCEASSPRCSECPLEKCCAYAAER
jgi:A/G-specific adenine glycosylase